MLRNRVAAPSAGEKARRSSTTSSAPLAARRAQRPHDFGVVTSGIVQREARDGASPAPAPAKTLIVDDLDAATVAGMRRGEFLSALSGQVTEVASAALGPEWSAAGCPYIETWFDRHRDDDAATFEALARRYSGLADASSAQQLIAAIGARLGAGIARWKAGEGITVDLIASGLLDESGGAPTEPGAPVLMKKRRDGAAVGAAGSHPEGALGPGRALDGPLAARMSQALGEPFDGVRIHDDPAAAAQADRESARAFTVGRHVVFGAGEYRPGTLTGDVLLAHELAHVVQQRRGAGAGQGREERGVLEAAETSADQAAAAAALLLYGRGEPAHVAGRSGLTLQRCDKSKPPPPSPADAIKALENMKAQQEKIVAAGSGKSLGEVGAAYAQLADISQKLGVAKTGTGAYQGSKMEDGTPRPPTPGVTTSDCTDIALRVLQDTFTQQGRAADWAKVMKQTKVNTAARAGSGLSGLDVQAALQSEAGWKGIFWAPDPRFSNTDLNPPEGPSGPAVAYNKVKSQGTYFKDFGKSGYPGITIDQSVVNYAPEQGSKTSQDTTGLDKLKKLPFGILAAHGGFHMTIITHGQVIEVHWDKPATDPNVVQKQDLETWAIGPKSHHHYWGHGAIVAPAADVDAAFK